MLTSWRPGKYGSPVAEASACNPTLTPAPLTHAHIITVDAQRSLQEWCVLYVLR